MRRGEQLVAIAAWTPLLVGDGVVLGVLNRRPKSLSPNTSTDLGIATWTSSSGGSGPPTPSNSTVTHINLRSTSGNLSHRAQPSPRPSVLRSWAVSQLRPAEDGPPSFKGSPVGIVLARVMQRVGFQGPKACLYVEHCTFRESDESRTFWAAHASIRGETCPGWHSEARP